MGKNTYEVFGLENENPTFAYELDEAVEDGYLVDYSTVEALQAFLKIILVQHKEC